jgi:peptidoglycan hydrolase-like protein with peptidoglycan-binding domain
VPAETRVAAADRRQVQEALHRLGYYQGPIDGGFGPLTRAAIRRFQHDINAAASTGYLTEEEANRLVRTPAAVTQPTTGQAFNTGNSTPWSPRSRCTPITC